jgi:hypothetical protein
MPDEASDVMRIIADDGEFYFIPGRDEQDAFDAFGEGCTIQHGTFVPAIKET